MKEVNELLQATARFQRLTSEFHRESDRGCAVLAICVLEESLRALIKARVVDPSDIGRLAPRGSLDAAIGSARQLGLLSDRQAKAFRQLVAVRNKFAHGVLEGLSFSTPEIESLVLKAEPAIAYPGNMYELLNNRNPKTYFLMLVAIMWLLLSMALPNVERLKPMGDPSFAGVVMP